MAEVAGALRERVRLERHVPVRGPAGDRADSWQLVAERWAQVEPAGLQGSLLAADTRHSARRWRVTWRAGPAAELDMRLVWRGMALRVTGIAPEPARGGLVTLLAEDMMGAGDAGEP